MNKLIYEIASYGRDVEDFMAEYSLPPEWFDRPDHLAIKAADPKHFDRLIEQFKADEFLRVIKILCTVMDNRRIATAFLASELLVGETWGVDLIEIMQPRPEMERKDKVGIDHMEFYWMGRLQEIDSYLQTRSGILPEWQPRTGHNTLSVPFGNNRELKFTDRRLYAVVTEDKISGTTEVIYQREET